MTEHSTFIIAKNIKLVRESLGLSQKDFAILVGISRSSIIKIEDGKANYNIALINNVLNFTHFDLQQVSSSNFKVPDYYREKLIKVYHKDLTKRIILENQPPLVFCIKNYLLKTSFLDQPKEIKEIVVFFKISNWNFSGNSIQIALKRMPELIEIRKHESKDNTNIYLRR
ncbi:helix-turn-helix transcriptional regulator [Pedobacter arcticus]|uniref:helix-turn-helix transcriptional regulator n=1 Tax=Pedobacter arcticus TaxID=752140 RepID=UPI0003625F0B|nr:helix-turn-helix transcriptional regulator [Pedobacter arcticus]